MNPHVLNGERLFQQGRHGEAAQAYRRALAEQPQDAHSHAMLALALGSEKQLDEAADAAQEALRLDPELALAHYAQGMVALIDGKLDQAAGAAKDAIRLSPTTAEYYRLLALVQMSRRELAEALASIESALAQDPEQSDCLNLRSQILLRMNRRGEASQTSAESLASNPDDADSQANAGWTALHNNDTKRALGHFKEALRLEPGHAWAKSGLAEALKARNPLYRLLLGFVLWMARLDPRVRIGVIVGGYLAYRFGRGIAETNPGIEPFLWPLLVAYLAFAWMTWIGMPLADLVLRVSPYGRHALDDRQRLVSTVLGGFLVLGLGLGGAYLATGHFGFGLGALQAAMLALITVGVLLLYRAPRYPWLLGGCGLLAAFVAGYWLLAAMDDQGGLRESLFTAFLWGFIGMMWFVALGGAGRPRGAI